MKILVMKKYNLLLLILFAPLCAISQDIIIAKNGSYLNCKIIKEDSSKVFYETKVKNRLVAGSMNMSEVKKIIYPKVPNEKTKSENELGLTVGFLQGGGSLIGADLEMLFPNSIGIQFGLGIAGYGCAFNVHLKKTIRSSFLSLQYLHQGIGDSFSQSLIGPAFVYRGNKWLTAQLGFGIVQNRGSAYPVKNNYSPLMLTYAFGAYLPL